MLDVLVRLSCRDVMRLFPIAQIIVFSFFFFSLLVAIVAHPTIRTIIASPNPLFPLQPEPIDWTCLGGLYSAQIEGISAIHCFLIKTASRFWIQYQNVCLLVILRF